MPRLIALKLIRQWRPRPHKRHIILQHVEELRQLIKAGPPQKPSDQRDPRIIGDLEHAVRLQIPCDQLGDVLLVDTGIVPRIHRAELIEVELPPIVANPPLAKQHRPA